MLLFIVLVHGHNGHFQLKAISSRQCVPSVMVISGRDYKISPILQEAWPSATTSTSCAFEIRGLWSPEDAPVIKDLHLNRTALYQPLIRQTVVIRHIIDLATTSLSPSRVLTHPGREPRRRRDLVSHHSYVYPYRHALHRVLTRIPIPCYTRPFAREGVG